MIGLTERVTCGNMEPGIEVEILCRQENESYAAETVHWLSPREHQELQTFSCTIRRDDWLAGRWCAKRLLTRSHGKPSDWEVLSRQSREKGRPPEVYFQTQPAPQIVSIAHCRAAAIAVSSRQSREIVGVDVVEITRFPQSFTRTWFAAAERKLLADWGYTPLHGWAMKEAAFKSLRTCESFRPHDLPLAMSASQAPVIIPRKGTFRGTIEIQIDHLATWIVALARRPHCVDECRS